MKEESYNEDILTQYLLGNLAEEQMLQVEVAFLRDDQSYEQILAVENELFYRYAQNKLSPDERERFEIRLLTSEQNRKRAMIASELSQKMREAQPVGVTDKNILEESQNLWRSLKSYLSVQGGALKISLSALIIMSIALIWLIFGIVRLRREINLFQLERATQEERLRRQAEAESARAAELNLKLKNQFDENAKLRQKLIETRPQASRRVNSFPTVFSLIIDPSIIRDQASGIKKLYLPSGARLLNLRLKLKGKEYKSYKLAILTADGDEIFSRDKLQSQRSGQGRSIVLSLPARILEEGDYELRLEGYASDGMTEETKDYYYLSVRRK